MYARKVISKTLSEIRPSVSYINSKGNTEEVRFELKENSIAECQEAVDFFNDKIDFELYEKTVDKGSGKTKIEFKKGWKPELEHIIWIENERILSKHSWPYWSERYYKISDRRNQFRQYSANRAQKIWDRIDARLQEKELAVKRQNGKARQQGSTTHSQGKCLHRIIFYPDIKAVTASYDKSATAIMAQMMTDAMARQPFWLRPKVENMQTDDYYFYENKSILNLGTGTAKVISTGTTPTVGHLSEIPKFLYPEQSIIQSLLPSMHDDPVIFLVLEGTAEGRNNFWHELWKENVAGMESGDYLLYPNFIPYCARDDIYPTEAWMRQHSSGFERFTPSTETIIHAQKLKNYITTNPDLRWGFGANWRLSREKMFWYEKERARHKKNGTLHIFLQEFPADPEEMFQNPGSGIYPIEVINHYENVIGRHNPEVYKLRSTTDEIPEILQPLEDEIDRKKPSILVTANWDTSIPASEFELVPILFNGWERFNPKNKILLFDKPDAEFEYGAALDTSDGLGEKVSDDAIIQIVRNGTVEHRDKQVCEFASPDIPPLQFWPILMAVCTLFSPIEQLLLTIEINKGEEVQSAMMNRGWWNLFLRKDDTTVSENANAIRRFGIYTSPRVRQLLMAHIHSFIKNMWLEILSMPFVSEMKDLKTIKLLTRTKEVGQKDNRFVAMAICLYALHKNAMLGREKKTWEERKIAATNIIIPPSFNNYNLVDKSMERSTMSIYGFSDESNFEDIYEEIVRENEIDIFEDYADL